jgi:predicted DNA-binding transcriptional regulator YafY
VTTREVDPYGLGLAGQAWNRASWYLVGHCHLRNDLRVFKVDRIQGGVTMPRGKSEQPDFEPPPGFRVRDHLNRTRWEMRELASALGGGGDRPPFVARVRFQAGVGAAVLGLVPNARVEAQDERSSVLAFDVLDPRWFARFLLPYLGQMEVLGPPELESELEEVARETLARYRGGAR